MYNAASTTPCACAAAVRHLRGGLVGLDLAPRPADYLAPHFPAGWLCRLRANATDGSIPLCRSVGSELQRHVDHFPRMSIIGSWHSAPFKP